MEKINWGRLLRYASLILLAAAITFSNRTFILGVIDPNWPRQIVIRVEDILIVILGIILIFHFLAQKKHTIIKPPLFFILLLWIGLELASSLINSMVGNLPASRIPFYTLKVAEYAFIFFYVFSYIKNSYDVKVMMSWWLIFIWIHLAYIFYQLFDTSSHSIHLIGEIGNFNIGGQFFILFVYSFSFYLFYILKQHISALKKILLGILFIMPIIGTFTPAIKAGATATVFASLLMILLYIFKFRSLQSVKHIVVTLLAIGAIFFGVASLSQHLAYDFIRARTLNFPSYITSLSFRAAIWQDHVAVALQSPLQLLIGRGGADPFAEASHNQFVRNLGAGGIIGSILFFILIFSIIKKSFRAYREEKNPLVTAFAVGLLASTLGMLILSLSGEAFFIIRPAEHFWYFAGLAFAVLYKIKNEPRKAHS